MWKPNYMWWKVLMGTYESYIHVASYITNNFYFLAIILLLICLDGYKLTLCYATNKLT